METQSNDPKQISPAIKKYGPWGGTTGEEREIDDIVDNIARIVKFSVCHGHVVDAIIVDFQQFDGKKRSYKVGGNGGNKEEFNLDPDEYIMYIGGCYGVYEGKNYVISMEIKTNLNVYGPFGRHDGQLDRFKFKADVGGQIIGFHGRYERYMQAIGVYVKEGEPLHQHVRPQEEEHLRQQFRKMCNDNKALERMAKEHEYFRYWIESGPYNKLMFTWCQPSDLTYSDKDHLGFGGYGHVYKGVFNGKEVAIKIPEQERSSSGERESHRERLERLHRERQFDQEIAILRTIRHPNLVTLVGACQEGHVLVYEHLSGGSLRDKVLSWSDRTKIAAKICSTLLFLHNTKPNPIVHGDLKPENILFDSQNVCKLSDFGISRFLEGATKTGTAMHKTEIYKGTPAYRDPEYEKTHILTCQSDVYAFGIILLQLVTGDSSAEGLRNKVLHEIGSLENFINKTELAQKMILGRFRNFSGDWPIDEAVKMTCLGIQCSEYLRKNRPDLEKDVWVEIVNGFASIDI